MLHSTLALLLALQQPQSAAPAGAVARVVISPAQHTVVAGDSLRLHAEALDAQGKPVPGARIRFVGAGGSFEGSVDSTGLVRSGAVGTLPVTAVVMVPDAKPIVQRIEVRMVAGPAARVEITPSVTRLLPGQRINLSARSLSKSGDVRADDHIKWSSSVPAAVHLSSTGLLTAVAPGRAIVSASTGGATERVTVEVLPGNVGAIELTPAATQARTGDVIHFKASVRDAGDKEIAGLTPTFLFTGKGEIGADGSFVGYEPGTYQVTASFGAKSADATVTLAPREARRTAKVVGKVARKDFMTSEVWLHPNGKVAYLGTHMGGDRVYAIDIANPAAPTIIDSIVVNARVINDMMTTPDGNYMVITREGAADRKNGIVIADTHDPLHPKAISEFTDGVTAGVHSAFIHQQAKHGTHIYLTNDGTGRLHVIDIQDPAHPKEVAQWSPRPGGANVMLHDIDVQDGLLYGSWWNDGLVILDVGNGIKGGTPSNPKLVTQYKYDLNALYKDVETEGGPGFIRGTHTAWRHKNYVFIADEVFGNDAAAQLGNHGISRAHGRLQVLDVRDIEHPKSVAWYEPEYGGVHNVWVAGDTLYMGAYNAGFIAFDVSGELKGDLRAQGRQIAQVLPMDAKGWIPNAPMTWGVVVKNNLIYVNDANSGLYIVRLEPKAAVVP